MASTLSDIYDAGVEILRANREILCRSPLLLGIIVIDEDDDVDARVAFLPAK